MSKKYDVIYNLMPMKAFSQKGFEYTVKEVVDSIRFFKENDTQYIDTMSKSRFEDYLRHWIKHTKTRNQNPGPSKYQSKSYNYCKPFFNEFEKKLGTNKMTNLI